MEVTEVPLFLLVTVDEPPLLLFRNAGEDEEELEGLVVEDDAFVEAAAVEVAAVEVAVVVEADVRDHSDD